MPDGAHQRMMNPSLLGPTVRWRRSKRFRDSRSAYNDSHRKPVTNMNDNKSVANSAVAAVPPLSPPGTTVFAFTDYHERRLFVFEFLSLECRGQSPKIPAIRTAERVRVRAIYGQDHSSCLQALLTFPLRAARARHFWLNPQEVRMIPAIYDPHCNLNWSLQGAYAVCRRHMISSGILSHLSESTPRCSRGRYAAKESRPIGKVFNEATDPANVILTRSATTSLDCSIFRSRTSFSNRAL